MSIPRLLYNRCHCPFMSGQKKAQMFGDIERKMGLVHNWGTGKGSSN